MLGIKGYLTYGIAMEWQTITLSRNEKCPACQDRPAYLD